MRQIRKDVSKDASDVISKFIEEKIENHKKEKHNIDSFKTELEQLGKFVDDVQGFPLVIIVDELDRCRPSYAVEVIEKIKHLFSTRNVVFILSVNSSELQKSIKSIYGDIDAKSYLTKFCKP